MAIVDIKHTQTIEEMLRDGGGSSSEWTVYSIPCTYDAQRKLVTSEDFDTAYTAIESAAFASATILDVDAGTQSKIFIPITEVFDQTEAGGTRIITGRYYFAAEGFWQTFTWVKGEDPTFS